MRAAVPLLLLLLGGAGVSLASSPAHAVHPWLNGRPGGRRLSDIPPPPAATRLPLPDESFGAWLRTLPLKPDGTPVRLFDGRPKADQGAHAAVLDIDTGTRDLQQCADAVMRLRAEYLFATGRAATVTFRFTCGEPVPFARWTAGERPRIDGHRVRWQAQAAPDSSYTAFRRYLDTVFAYAGSASLAGELVPRPPRAVHPGDVFIHGGAPGHAVLVADVAVETATGRRLFLLVQSYMPAQDVHVLKNHAEPHLSPWFALPADGAPLRTPHWTFAADELRAWP